MTPGASPQDLSTNPSPSAPSRPADPFIGLSVNGRFTISRLIGEGGMGSVYEARQEPLGRKVAIKLLKSDVADEHTRERFEREAKILSALQHPNLVTLYDFGTATLLGESQFYIAMEFIQGQDLDARLRSGPPLEPDALMHLILGVAQGLSEAHRNNIVHRDLKPANLLLAPLHSNRFGFSPKILDFGIGRFGKVQSHLTQTGMVFGTPAYMAPEQATGSAEIGPHTDIYTFGVILYELLSGARPFVTNAPLQLIFAHANKPPPPLILKPEYEGKIPSGLLRLVEWSLNKDPFDRPISKPPADCTTDEERQRCLVLLLEQAIAASNPSLLGMSAPQSFNTEAISAVRFGASASGVSPVAPAWSSSSPSNAPITAAASSAPSARSTGPSALSTGPSAYDASPPTTPAIPTKNPFYAAPPSSSASSDANPKTEPSAASIITAYPAPAPVAIALAKQPLAPSDVANDATAEAKHVTSLRALSPPSPTRVTQPPNRKPLIIAAAILLAVILLIWLLSSSEDSDSTDTSQATPEAPSAPTADSALQPSADPSAVTVPKPSPPAPAAANPTPAPVAADPAPAPATANPTPAPVAADPTPTPVAADPTPTPTPTPTPAPVAADPTPTPTPVAADPTPTPTPAPTVATTPTSITVTIPLPISEADAELNRLIGLPSASSPGPSNKGKGKGKDKHKDKPPKGHGKKDH
jgi:eukaryotic-like serine/threonine-protein kinase